MIVFIGVEIKASISQKLQSQTRDLKYKGSNLLAVKQAFFHYFSDKL